MVDVPRPSQLPRFASEDVTGNTTGVNNVIEPPDSIKNVGWAEFIAPARNFFNWIHRLNYEWARHLDDMVNGRNRVTDGAGTDLFNKENVLITIYAVDSTTPANYLFGVGYRSNGAPSINVISQNNLALGNSTATGTQEVTGGNQVDIIIYGVMQKNI